MNANTTASVTDLINLFRDDPTALRMAELVMIHNAYAAKPVKLFNTVGIGRNRVRGILEANQSPVDEADSAEDRLASHAAMAAFHPHIDVATLIDNPEALNDAITKEVVASNQRIAAARAPRSDVTEGAVDLVIEIPANFDAKQTATWIASKYRISVLVVSRGTGDLIETVEPPAGKQPKVAKQPKPAKEGRRPSAIGQALIDAALRETGADADELLAAAKAADPRVYFITAKTQLRHLADRFGYELTVYRRDVTQKTRYQLRKAEGAIAA